MDLLLVSNILSYGLSGNDRPFAGLFSKKEKASAAVEPKEIGKRGGEESNGSGGDRRPARKSPVPCFALEFDGLNFFETLVSH